MGHKEYISRGSRNLEWGALAESIAVAYLVKNGYTIRARNLRLGNIELDIIAEIPGSIVFIEVKARKGDFQNAVEAVDAKKRSKMIKGADIYLRNLDRDYAYRFDIIAVTGEPDNYNIEHLPDAFIPTVSRMR